MMCSAEFLEERVKEYCIQNKKDEGVVWQLINDIHTKEYKRDIMWKKQQFEKEHNLSDIPMAEQFAKEQLVHNVIEILKTKMPLQD